MGASAALERQSFLSRRFNAFFTHGEARYFLARRDGRVVGAVSRTSTTSSTSSTTTAGGSSGSSR
jgi:hypothetical protein